MLKRDQQGVPDFNEVNGKKIRSENQSQQVPGCIKDKDKAEFQRTIQSDQPYISKSLPLFCRFKPKALFNI